jgi:hypothetical protein
MTEYDKQRGARKIIQVRKKRDRHPSWYQMITKGRYDRRDTQGALLADLSLNWDAARRRTFSCWAVAGDPAEAMSLEPSSFKPTRRITTRFNT